MTIPLTGGGGLFTRLGHIFGGVADALALQGATATARVLAGSSMLTREATLQSDYGAGTAALQLINGDNGFGQSATPLYQSVDSWQNTFNQFFSNLQIIAQNTIIKMADTDAGGLLQRTLPYALSYLIAQMQATSESVNATTVVVGAQTAVGTPTGNPVIVVSALNGYGQTIQYAFGETLTFACTADAQTGGATAKQEALTVTGQAAVSNSFAYNWPGGSGASTPINACDSTVNNSGAAINALQNSDFETFTTANNPDNWTIATGVAGTSVISGGSGNAYKGANCVGFVGDSATLTAITQLFNQAPSVTVGAGGTSFKPAPLTPYAVNVEFKLSAASPTAGVLEIALIDGTGTIINDASGTANSVTANLHSIADTSFHNVNAVFRLPAVLPSTIKLRVRLSTALTTGTTVYVDGLAMNPMKQFYAGGPFVSVFSGPTNMILGDSWTVAFTPTWGLVQQYMDRFCGMKSLGLQIPGNVAPTVADSVIA